ncbi:hypothetical protein [Neomegalonema perideroedes]|uniref:hypothetical protein n=1 Tax=Neomegalonema perideroedes TaxID=217219 RepID=UPI00037DE458|nr:hypothetical protein [Neomegalonema perideroedes]
MSDRPSPDPTKPEEACQPPDRGAYVTMFFMGILSAPYLLLWLFRDSLDALASLLAQAFPIFAPRVEFLERVSPATKAPYVATLITGLLMAPALIALVRMSLRDMARAPKPPEPQAAPNPILMILGAVMFFGGFWHFFIDVPAFLNSARGLRKSALIGMGFPIWGVLNLLILEVTILAGAVLILRRLRRMRAKPGL